MGLDPETAERLLRRAGGEEVNDDLAGLARLLDAARGPLPESDPGRKADTVAAMVAAVRGGVAAAPAMAAGRAGGRVPRRARWLPAAVGVAGALSLVTGLTAAGALPGPAQHGLSAVLAKAGIDVPNGRSGHGHDGHPETANSNSPGGQPAAPASQHSVDRSAGATAAHPATATSVPPPPCPPGTENHGEYVSGVAHPTTSSTVAGATTTTVRHGQTVSEAARSDCGKPAASSPTTVGPTGTATTSTTEPHEANAAPEEAPAPGKGAPPDQSHRPADVGSRGRD